MTKNEDQLHDEAVDRLYAGLAQSPELAARTADELRENLKEGLDLSFKDHTEWFDQQVTQLREVMHRYITMSGGLEPVYAAHLITKLAEFPAGDLAELVVALMAREATREPAT